MQRELAFAKLVNEITVRPDCETREIDETMHDPRILREFGRHGPVAFEVKSKREGEQDMKREREKERDRRAVSVARFTQLGSENESERRVATRESVLLMRRHSQRVSDLCLPRDMRSTLRVRENHEEFADMREREREKERAYQRRECPLVRLNEKQMASQQ